MNIFLKNHNRKYDIESMALLFFPGEKFVYNQSNYNGITVKSFLRLYGNYSFCISVILDDKKKKIAVKRVAGTNIKAQQAAIKLSFYFAGVKWSGVRPPWGILTGIRPAKMAYDLADGNNFENANRILVNDYLIYPSKAKLCCDVAYNRSTLKIDEMGMAASLYIAIPFCPSRCLYCSFTSHTSKKLLEMIPEYIELLVEELKHKAEIFDALNLSLKTVYIGGGTPSILTPKQIEMLLSTIKCYFDLSNLAEYTFEAGRPDTVTADKLDAIKSGGVSRISINAQTMNNRILKDIGRCHSSEDYIMAFESARKADFRVINTDLIAGFPGEDFQSFNNSLDSIIAMNPENITVHALCIKRASDLNIHGNAKFSAESSVISKQLNYTHKIMKEKNYIPYYLYRQKNTLGNLENTGYSKKGYEGLYNIIMMDELHSVIGAGAGAVTKLVLDKNHKIERIFNPKYPYEYRDCINEIINQKSKVIRIYDNYNKK